MYIEENEPVISEVKQLNKKNQYTQIKNDT